MRGQFLSSFAHDTSLPTLGKLSVTKVFSPPSPALFPPGSWWEEEGLSLSLHTYDKHMQKALFPASSMSWLLWDCAKPAQASSQSNQPSLVIKPLMSPIGLFKAQMGHISLVWSHRAAPQSPKTSQGCWRQWLWNSRDRPQGSFQPLSCSSLRHQLITLVWNTNIVWYFSAEVRPTQHSFAGVKHRASPSWNWREMLCRAMSKAPFREN